MRSLCAMSIAAGLFLAAVTGCGSGGTDRQVAPTDATAGAGDDAGTANAAITNPSCNLCHRAPPPPPHPQVSDQLESCAICHSTTIGPNGFLLPSGTHLNGRLDVSCTGCHGFPPASPHPQWQDTPCATCHTDTLNAGRHANGNVELIEGGCGFCHGAPPPPPHPASALSQCVVCHTSTTTQQGGLVPFGPHMNGQLDVSCTGCHGFPPGPPHPQWADTPCATCHTDTLNAARHMNGNVELIEGGCSFCHGFPPPAPHPQAAGVSCQSCHPESVTQLGGLVPGGPHMNGVVNASCNVCHGFPPPAPHPQDTSCGNCHGDTIGAGTHMNTRVELTPGSCTVCHGAPPPPPHPQSTLNQCVACHQTTVNADASLVPNGTHMNGRIDVTCTGCHGNPPPAPHPARTDCAACHGDNFAAGQHMNGTVDLLASSCRACHGVPPNSGEHDKHVNDEGFACGECHPGFTRTTINAPLHMNGQADVQLPSGIRWNGAAAQTCTGRCHGEDHGTEEWREGGDDRRR